MIENLLHGTARLEFQMVDPTEISYNEAARIEPLEPKIVELIHGSYTMLGGLQLQPILLNPDLELIDGFHRLRAATESGMKEIAALIVHGLDSPDDLQLLEAEANRARKQRTPAQALEVWTRFYEPAIAAQNSARKQQNLRNQTSIQEIRESRAEVIPSSTLRQAAKETTGYSLDTLDKIRAVRAAAEDESAAEEVRAAAERGYRALAKQGAQVDPIFKKVARLQAKSKAPRVDPALVEQQRLTEVVERVAKDTTLLAERLHGDLGKDLTNAATLGHVLADEVRGIRIALTYSLAALLTVEATTADNLPTAQAFFELCTESADQLSELGMKLLEIREVHDGETV